MVVIFISPVQEYADIGPESLLNSHPPLMRLLGVQKGHTNLACLTLKPKQILISKSIHYELLLFTRLTPGFTHSCPEYMLDDILSQDKWKSLDYSMH